MAIIRFFFENALGGAIQCLYRRIKWEISSSVFRYLQVVLWYRVDLCEKGGWSLGWSALLSLGTIHRSFWGGREYLCAFSGSAVSSLYAIWPVPARVAVPFVHHLWGTEKRDRCVKKLTYIYQWCWGRQMLGVVELGGGYECGDHMVLRCMQAFHYLCVFPSCVFFVGVCFHAPVIFLRPPQVMTTRRGHPSRNRPNDIEWGNRRPGERA